MSVHHGVFFSCCVQNFAHARPFHSSSSKLPWQRQLGDAQQAMNVLPVSSHALLESNFLLSCSCIVYRILQVTLAAVAPWYAAARGLASLVKSSSSQPRQ
jgi:hypothetical protein